MVNVGKFKWWSFPSLTGTASPAEFSTAPSDQRWNWAAIFEGNLAWCRTQRLGLHLNQAINPNNLCLQEALTGITRKGSLMVEKEPPSCKWELRVFRIRAVSPLWLTEQRGRKASLEGEKDRFIPGEGKNKGRVRVISACGVDAWPSFFIHW